MDPASFVESVEDARQTELQRLGSGKLLIAVTGADLSASTVLETVAAHARAARERFEGWAAVESENRAREVFEAAASAQDAAYERVVAELDGAGPDEAAAADPLGGVPEGFADSAERAGGLVGWALVADRVYAQVVGFFVNAAEPARTDLFRELREEVGAVRADALDLLVAACDSEADRERAADAAGSVVEAAYGEYVATLEGMGLDPKPVC